MPKFEQCLPINKIKKTNFKTRYYYHLHIRYIYVQWNWTNRFERMKQRDRDSVHDSLILYIRKSISFAFVCCHVHLQVIVIMGEFEYAENMGESYTQRNRDLKWRSKKKQRIDNKTKQQFRFFEWQKEAHRILNIELTIS